MSSYFDCKEREINKSGVSFAAPIYRSSVNCFVDSSTSTLLLFLKRTKEGSEPLSFVSDGAWEGIEKLSEVESLLSEE